MKKVIDKVVLILILLLYVLMVSFMVWFLQGGDIRELMSGCFDARGCT